MNIELTERQGKTLQQLLETEIRRYRILIDYWHGIDPAGREFLVSDSIQHYTKKTRDLDELLNLLYKAQETPPKKKKIQVRISYHPSLMDEYKTISINEFDNKGDAEKWIDKMAKKLWGFDNDPENPLSDLYDVEIQEIEVTE